MAETKPKLVTPSTEDPRVEQPKKTEPPSDAADMDSLWLDPSLGDGLVDTHFHHVAVGKPKDFFRVNFFFNDTATTEIYTHKVENVIDEQNFIVGPAMRGRFDHGTRRLLRGHSGAHA